MSNRLPILAEQIKSAHNDTVEASNLAAQRALDAGIALVEAKELVKHGDWLPFLKEARVPERTAQRYMTLARSNLKSDTVSLLGGVMPALRFLKLRDLAYRQMTRAWDAAENGNDDPDEELVSLETALMLMDEMIAMFPEKMGGAA